ncbi:MAG: hypothetical protein AAGG75_03905 [Bacteroidota bacterium]
MKAYLFQLIWLLAIFSFWSCEKEESPPIPNIVGSWDSQIKTVILRGQSQLAFSQRQFLEVLFLEDGTGFAKEDPGFSEIDLLWSYANRDQQIFVSRNTHSGGIGLIEEELFDIVEDTPDRQVWREVSESFDFGTQDTLTAITSWILERR